LKEKTETLPRTRQKRGYFAHGFKSGICWVS